MAEIKSTIELAMERTKHLVMTDKEKKEMEYREHMEKIPGFAQKYLDGIMGEEEVKRALEALPESVKEEAKKKFIASVLEKTNTELAMKALNIIKEIAPSGDRQLIEELRALVSHYESKLREASVKIEKEIRRELERLRISGSAIKVIPEKSRRYRMLMQEFREAFVKAKEKCIAVIGGRAS